MNKSKATAKPASKSSNAKKTAKSAKAAKSAGRGSYHHGDLAAVLLAESETILEKEGIAALTLRAAARAAGVSHTAPQNHFGDLTGLLSELAAAGFVRLVARIVQATGKEEPNTPRRQKAVGHAYVAFARAHPGLFTLMFRGERLDTSRPALARAIGAMRQTLATAAGGAQQAGAAPPAPSLARLAYATAMWSVVHGYAMLLIDGRLKNTLAQLPEGESADTLLEQILDVTGAPRK